MDRKETEQYIYEDRSDLPAAREAVGRFRVIVGVLFVVGAMVLSAISLLTGVIIGTARERRSMGGRTVIFVQGGDYNASLRNEDGSLTVAGVVECVKDSVVEIFCETADGMTVLSGLVVGADGFIVTGYGIVAEARSLSVKFADDPHPMSATFYAGDEISDIAVLRVGRSGLTQVCFGDSDALRMGDPVLAMGRPVDGAVMTVDEGIIYALEHRVPDWEDEMTCLQTTASAGVSLYGGGLFNMAGQLVGFMRPAPDTDGTSYVYPANRIWPLVGDLITKGYVSGRVNVDVVSLREYEEESGLVRPGVYVCGLNEDADNPFRVGDEILAVDGTPVEGIRGWVRALNRYNVGDTVTVTVKRGGQTVEVQLTLEEKTK